MAAATDELMLLERVFIRLGSAETDEQLQAAVCKFLPPVLLKLSSSQEGVRKKVMELLVHINRRVKSRPQVQLPVDALLLQYQDPVASSFVINFTIIYIKLGYPRLEMKKQTELISGILNAVEGKPLSHQDSLLLMIMPTLGHIDFPKDPEKCKNMLGLQDKPQVAKQLINFMLDVLLLPYGSINQTKSPQSGQGNEPAQPNAPPGMSEYAYKRVLGETPPTAEQLEQMKLGIVKFLVAGLFPESSILIHLIVAAADTRFSIANMADLELKKIISSIDWSSVQLASSLYSLFLGTDTTQRDVRPEMRRQPASTRIRLKLLHYMCHITSTGYIIPPCIQVVFNALYGKNTNLKLKSLALQFTSNIVQQCCLTPLLRVAAVILNGMMKLICEGEDALKNMAFTVIGQIGQRIPSLVNKDLRLLQNLFDFLTTNDADTRLHSTSIRDTLISLTPAYVLKKDDDDKIIHMNALLAAHIESPESCVRFVAMHYAATVFPSDDVPSRYLLLLACGDCKQEISTEAKKALYDTIYKNKENQDKEILLPEFSNLVTYIYEKMQARLSNPRSERITIGSKTLPYNTVTYSEIINYLRICLAKAANIEPSNTPFHHPNENTPLIKRYLQNLYNDQKNILDNYLNMILTLGHASGDQVSLSALLEMVGCTAEIKIDLYKKELSWLRNLIVSTSLDVRQLASQIYGHIISYEKREPLEKRVQDVITLVNDKSLEAKHGGLLTLSNTIERKLIIERVENTIDLLTWKTYIEVVNIICKFLDETTPLTLLAAVEGIGLLGKTHGLPLPSEGNKLCKKAVVDKLFLILYNAKSSNKIKQAAALSLGYLCLGENFPHVSYIIEKFISKAEDTKDIEIHLSIGEALVCCIQGPNSLERRDAWSTLMSEHNIASKNNSDTMLLQVLDKLIIISKGPHPNSRQATCAWILALLERNIKEECLKSKLQEIHRSFIDFLSDDSDIIQDMAAKGLGLAYMNSDKEERESLVSAILDQFMQGRRTVKQVTPDTKLFEEGQISSSSNRNLSTYREICSLATEVQRPDFVYYFMHLANQNVKWTSKKGAGFGFAAIANIASDELNKYLPHIVPRLYRYQFDPTPKIQQSMTSIWHAIIPSTQKAVEQYHKEILLDLTTNLTNYEWRIRLSCCLALSDLLRMNVAINLLECAPQLFKQLFRVMDDTHENTRIAATNTTKVLSKVCIRQCDVMHGKTGEKVLQAILPILLDIGIMNTVDTVRDVSLYTISQLITSAGVSLKPSLINLIPALLIAVGDTESPKLSYMSNVYGAAADTQNVIDNFRASAAKGHYATDAITKCIQYIDSDTLKELMPKVIDLIKSSIGFGTKIVCSHFLIHLYTQLRHDLQPYSGKILSALLNGLADRNAAVRKNNAVAIGHIVGSAKDSSVEKLFNTLYNWYMDKEEEIIRIAVGHTLQAINNHNQEIIRNYIQIAIPLIFFAMHVEKTPENENVVEMWTDLWNDITPGTEAGIRQNLETILATIKSALESSSWTKKKQAADSINTMALKLGSDIDNETRNTLIRILVDKLQGRIWTGKDRLLVALSTLACNNKTALMEDNKTLILIVESLYKEVKRGPADYRRKALKAFADVLHDLNVDKFAEVYDIAQEILIKISNKNGDDSDDDNLTESVKKKEENIILQEAVYEALGKAWPVCKETQDKYYLQFINHCQDVLPNSTRSVQVAILVALNLFVDKLILLKSNYTSLSDEDKNTFNILYTGLCKLLLECMNSSKYTRLRKESLNIVLDLAKKFTTSGNSEQLDQLALCFKEILSELKNDNQPEIRIRVVDINNLLNY